MIFYSPDLASPVLPLPASWVGAQCTRTNLFSFSISQLFCTGEKGSSGLLGFPGMPGLPGVPGLNGFKGAPGTAGGKGSPGVVGLQGQKGEKLLKAFCWLCSRGA